MNRYPLHTFPELSSNPGPWEYFWHQLPYAVPGFVTFLVGLVLFCGATYAFLFRNEKRFYYLNFAITCLGFGFLGLVLASRAVILDKTLLLALNSHMYPLVLLLAPGSFHLLFFITEAKYRIIHWVALLSWMPVLLGCFGVAVGSAFTGKWLAYDFGNYPVAGFYLKPWGVFSTLLYFLVILPSSLHYIIRTENKSRIKFHMLIGVNILVLLTISNLPSFLGFPLFPGANFSFIPMLLLAYGVFRSDFLNLNDLLFKKNGMFYIINILLSLSLLAFTSALAFGLSPSHHTSTNWYPWILIPLGTALTVFALGTVIGGTNPGEKINQFGAFSLYIYGFLMCANIALALGLNPLVAHRIQQLCFIVFALALSIQFRFAFLAMGQPLPRYVIFFDLSAVFFSCMSLTPYLYIGYHSYYFGNTGAGGPILTLLGFSGFIALVIILKTWWKIRKIRKNPLGDFMALYIAIGVVLLLLNLPANNGIPLYPSGNLVFIPTLILAYAVLRYGALSVHNYAFKIGQRISLMGFIIFPFFMLFYYASTAGGGAPVPERIFHTILIASPLFLLYFLLTFLLSRPITEQFDRNYSLLEIARSNSEKAHEEITRLNEFSKKINETTDLDAVLDEIFDYFDTEFNIQSIILLLVDRTKNELFTYRTSIETPPFPTEEMRSYAGNLHVPLREESGVIFKTYKRKKPLFLSKVSPSRLREGIERKIVDRLELRSFLQVPLVIQKEAIGMMLCTSYRKSFKLSKSDIVSISRFCEQIAGAIYSSSLLKQVQEEREKTEKARAEIEKLNEFSKKINETTNFEKIIEQIFEYMDLSFGLNSAWLLLIDKKTNKFVPFFTESTGTRQVIDFLKNLSAPVGPESGSLFRTFAKKKTLYLKRIPKRDDVNLIDQSIMDAFKLKSFLHIPLIIQHEVIGIMMLARYNEFLEISKENIQTLERFCEQIAGAIYSSSLLKQVQEEREKSEKLLEDVLPEMAASDSSMTAAKSAIRSLLDLERKMIQKSAILYLPSRADDSFVLYHLPLLTDEDTSPPVEVSPEQAGKLNALIAASLLENGILLLPVRSDEKLLAVLEIPGFCMPGQEIGESSIRVMNSLANTLALKFENLEAEENKRLADIGSMAATIVHDLKNPIGTIKGCAELANDQEINQGSRQEFLNLICDEADRLSALAHEILEFSRGKINLNIASHDSEEFMFDNLRSLAPLFEENEIKLLCKINYEGVIKMDADRIRRVLLNLSNNSIDAMKNTSKENPVFNIVLNREIGQAVFTLADNGPGIPEDIRATLFEPFVTHGKSKGTGLGMAIVKKIVEAHEGTIRFETGSVGTTFFIELPVD